MKNYVSYSRVECFQQCRYLYFMRYVQKLEVLEDMEADNALYLGRAIHTGIEKGVDAAVREYYDNFPVIDDLQIEEVIKLEHLIPKVYEMIGDDCIFEYKLKAILPDGSVFTGFIDALKPVSDGVYDLYDFKYTSNGDKYKDSDQLHLYKFFFQAMTGKKIRNMNFIIIPKTGIRQKKSEDIYQFRKRLKSTLDGIEPYFLPIEYDNSKVTKWLSEALKIKNEKAFIESPSKLCDWCEYNNFCQKGIDYMLLPASERRVIGEIKSKKIWFYGEPGSGKTTMLDDTPKPLMLNTDGNIKYVTAPYITIADNVKQEGRRIIRKYGWEIFKEVIDELEKKDNDFQTIIIDLVEDLREMCRLYMYDRLGIEHESDSGYGKGWDIVKTEWLSTMKKFFNLPYDNLIIVSHEVTSEITKANGQKITKISPNISEKDAKKLAGMVDMVLRVIKDDDDSRWLSSKTSTYTFGGGRLPHMKAENVPLEWSEVVKIYDECLVSVHKTEPAKIVDDEEQPVMVEMLLPDKELTVDGPAGIEAETQPVERKTRKRRQPVEDATPSEEKPKREKRTRKREG